MENLFYETALILAASAILGAMALRFRQPLIVAFIAVGILVGPSGLHLAGIEKLQLLAEIGITILLFVVGLKLDLHLIRSMGPVALATGLGQVTFTSLFGFFIAIVLGMSKVGALYVAVALTFSSTIIIVKLLSDKREIDSLHGRIAIGFLIVQDIAVILAMIGLTALGAGEATGDGIWVDGLMVLLKGIGLIAGVALLMRFVLPRLLPQLARSQELLLVFAIAWAVLFAAAGDYLDFSKEVGAFLAGVSLASTPYREAISSRLVSLRDFLLLFFFIGLGAQLDLSLLGAQVGPALIFSAFVLIGNPLIVMAIMGFMGYRKRTGFLAGLTVAQISEFSLILGALGVSLGHIDRETLGLITLVGLITIGLSTYLILYSHPIYQRIAPFLGIFERKFPYRESLETGEPKDRIEVILFGLGRYGRNIARNLIRRGKRLLVVDFDPEVVASGPGDGIPVLYGAAEDPEILDHLPLDHARWIVNTVPGRETNLTLLQALRERNFEGKVVLTAHNQLDAETYRAAGANKVLWPFVDAAEQAVDYLSASREEFSELAPWPVALEEVRLRADSRGSGKKLGDLSLRERSGVSLVAVDRAGRSHFDPDSDFLLFPGDRLVLLGTEEGLKTARKFLEEREMDQKGEESGLQMAEFCLGRGSDLTGKSLAELDLRRRYGVSVIGIQRGDERIVSPSPRERLQPRDSLLVLGHPEAIRKLQAHQGPSPG